MARVTSEDFAERLRRSVEQAVAIKGGEPAAGYSVRRKLTANTVVVKGAPQVAPERRYPENDLT